MKKKGILHDKRSAPAINALSRRNDDSDDGRVNELRLLNIVQFNGPV